VAKASPLIAALNGGEWGPLLDGRTDMEGYSASAFRCVNFIPTIQGPILRRAGTGFIRQSGGQARLVPFVLSRDDAVMIEFGDLYCRFYVNRSPVVTGSPLTITGMTSANPVVVTSVAHGLNNGDDVFISGVAGEVQVNGRWFKVASAAANTFALTTIHGDNVDGTGYSAYASGGAVDIPYEIASPYSAAALTNSRGELGIDFAQRGDLIYITDRSRVLAPRILTRSGATSWAFTTLAPDAGPWQAMNSTDTTMYVSAATGIGITVTASAAIFSASDVGRIVRIDQQIITSTVPWETASAITAGDYRRSEGKEYLAATTATTGTTIPSHTSGTVTDGKVEWTYTSSGYGVVRITAQAGATATADVLIDFPQTLVGAGNASLLWRRGSWGEGEYPATVTFFGERLCLGGGLRLDMSVAGDYENFAVDYFGEVLAETAISLDMPGTANDIVGMQNGTALLVMTEGGEFAVGPQSANDVFGPNNVKAVGHTAYGARPIAPVKVGSEALYVQASGRKIRSMQFSWETDSFIAPDMTVRATHIATGGVSRLVRQETPYAIVWAVRADGELLSFTFDPTQQARAWARHTMGKVKDVAVIPAPDGSRDDVWIITSRIINGAPRSYIEYLRPEFEDGDNVADATYCDSGLRYDGTAVTKLYGFDHLDGESVVLLLDGATAPTTVVSNGEVTLPYAASTAQVGVAYQSYYATSRLDAGAADGTAQGKTKRITDCAFRVSNTLGGAAGPSLANMDDIPDLTYRSPSTPMGGALVLFSGDALLSWPSGYETDGRLWFSVNGLFPATIIAIMPQVVVQEGR